MLSYLGMAKDDDKRKAFWDDEEDEDTAQPQKSGTNPGMPNAGPRLSDSEQIDQKINETKVLMDQTHQLYLHYFNGIEKRPPIEKFRLLESKIKELERLGSATPTSRFKMAQFLQHFATFRELWERKMRDKEKN